MAGCRSRRRRWPGPAARSPATSGPAETYTGDQYSQVEVTSTQLTGGQWIGPAVRAQNGGQDTYLGIYFWNNGSPELRLLSGARAAGSSSATATTAGRWPPGPSWRCVAAGSTISFLQDGVERIAVTDSSLAGGAPGIMSYGAAGADNWSGANVSTYSVGGAVSGLVRDGGVAGQRRRRPQRQRQRPVHLRTPWPVAPATT